MKKINFDHIKSLLKGATFTIATTSGALIIQSFQDGMDIKESIILGLGVGVIAGIKNLFKHAWNIDLDLVRLKK